MIVTTTSTRTARTEWFRIQSTWQPLLSHLRSRPGPVTVFCGAVASGEEAYSVAMLLDHYDIPGRVIATDVDPELIAIARQASVQRFDVAQAAVAAHIAGVMTPLQVLDHMQEHEGTWTVSSAVRSRVTFETADLTQCVLPAADLVFARNVWRHLGQAGRNHLHGQLLKLDDGALLSVGGADLIDTTGRATGLERDLIGFVPTSVNGLLRRTA